MAQTPPVIFRDEAAVTAGKLRVPAADFDAGANNAGCTPGLGVGTTGSLVGNDNWTLLDQFGTARTPQVSQVVGGKGISGVSESDGIAGNGSAHGENIIEVTNDASGDGTVVDAGNMTLSALATGWVNI